MKHAATTVRLSSLSRDLFHGLFLLTVSVAGGWIAFHYSHSAAGSLHVRLLTVLLIHPFAIAAWIFCGLPGLALATKSLFGAIEQRNVMAGFCSVGLLALSLACASFWI